MDGQFSNLTQPQLSAFCSNFHIGSEFNAKVPGRKQPVNQPPRGMDGVYVSHFEEGNLRLPLRPFFRQILEHYRMHICQLTPFSVLKIVSFEMLCNALNISPTIPLFQHFFYLYPNGADWFTFSSHHHRSLMKTYKDKISNWKKKFFFVDIKHEMVMRTPSATDPEKGSYDENDAELLSRYTFHIQPLPQEMLWKTGLSGFKHAGDKEPTACLDVEAAHLLKYSQYIEKKVSTEVMEETERNVGEEEAISGKCYEDETGPFLIDEDSAGQMIENAVHYPCENQSNSNYEIQDFLELISLEQLKNDFEDLSDERIEQGVQTHIRSDDVPSRVSELSDVVPTVKKEQGGGGDFEDLIRDCDRLTKQKKDLQDEVAHHEAQWLHQQSLVKQKKEEYERKLSEVTALQLTVELESIAYRANLEEWEAKKQYFSYQISTLREKHKEIVTRCDNFVTEIQDRIRFESKEFKEKLRILCDAFKASEVKWKACENERLRLAQDRSWLIEKGIDMVAKRLMNSQEFYVGLSPIIAAAVNLGIAEGKLGIHNQSSPDELQSNVIQAAEMINETLLSFRELKWSYLEALATIDDESLEDLKNTIPKQTPEGRKMFIACLCDQLSSLVRQ